MSYKIEKTETEWKEQLGEERYKILRQKGTEYPHSGKYNLNYKKGTYCCGGCGEVLFESNAKFDAHCGWPSFDEEVPGAVIHNPDHSFGMHRIEIVCANCQGHLGHVFKGERMTAKNTRHCVNSLSIRFIPDPGKSD